MKFGGFELCEPPRSWLTDALTVEAPLRVLSRRFPACLRVLHPARFSPEHGFDVDLSWSYVESKFNVAEVHTGLVPSLNDALDETPHPRLTLPELGSLPPRQAWHLIDALEQDLADPADCWFGVWDGFGCLGQLRRATTCRFDVRGRRHLALHAPVSRAARPLCDRPCQSVNLWWGPDATWCVHTDIELDSTLIAGPRALVDRVRANSALETHVVTAPNQEH